MTTYEWNCRTVDAYPQNGGIENIIHKVHFIVTGTSSETNASVAGTQVLDTENIVDFVAFENLTNEIVTDWVKQAMGEDKVTEIEVIVQNKINALENPSSVHLKIEL